jgi:hypothetical protein
MTKLKTGDFIRWILTIAMIVMMWRGNKFCLYFLVTGLSVANEATRLAIKTIARRLK